MDGTHRWFQERAAQLMVALGKAVYGQDFLGSLPVAWRVMPVVAVTGDGLQGSCVAALRNC